MEFEKELKAVLVGCGNVSQEWMQAAREIPGLETTGFVDILEQVAQKRADEYGTQNAIIGTNLTMVLQKTAPDIVFNCTIPEAHSSTTIEALKHGCHVLCEKPIASTIEEARAMISAAQEARRLLAVVQNYRYEHSIRRLKAFVASNVIGPITTVNSDFYVGAHFNEFRSHMKHILLLDMAIHTFDAIRFITGADPVSVYCKEWNPSGSWYDHGASAVAIFEMTNGIVYTYRGSWCAEGLNTTWGADWRIICEKGTVRWDGDTDFRAHVVTECSGFFSTHQELTIPPYNGPSDKEGHAAVIREFIDCIKRGSVPETICTDNIKSFAMTLGAIESAERGKQVDIEWQGGHLYNALEKEC